MHQPSSENRSLCSTCSKSHHLTTQQRVEILQSTKKTACEKFIDRCKVFSIFSLDTGIYHDKKLSYIPAQSVMFTLGILVALVGVSLAIWSTLGEVEGERIWDLSLEETLSMSKVSDFKLNYNPI